MMPKVWIEQAELDRMIQLQQLQWLLNSFVLSCNVEPEAKEVM